MKKEEIEFYNELSELCKKYEIINAAFCGEMKENYLACLNVETGIEKELHIKDRVLCITNVGRLWQYCREAQKTILNKFERGW